VDIALMLLGVTAFPVAGLGLLLWLTHLEETLPRDVRSAMCASTPPPVLAVPVGRPEPALPPASTDQEWSRQARPGGAQALATGAQALPAGADVRTAG
jgi:hypothetical protein